MSIKIEFDRVITSSDEQRDRTEGVPRVVDFYVVNSLDFEALSVAVAGLGHYGLLVNTEPR